MTEPRLACVVMSLGNQPGLFDAVRSLAAQGDAAEIVVVNSGGGDPEPRLRKAGLHVRVVNVRERLLPGAARNAGIDATTAPYVAFLAGDCTAEPGWVAGRLREHDAGAPAVASAIVNASPAVAPAAATFLLMHHRRAPSGRPRRIDLYGLSYARDLFNRYGRFREDMRGGEDTEFNLRLSPSIDIAWAPDVRCAVRYPQTVAAMVRDQWQRGVVQIRATEQVRGRARRLRVAQRAARNGAPALVQALRRPAPGERRAPLAALPLVPVAALARAGGVVAARDDAARQIAVGVMDRDSWDANTDVVVVVDTARKTLTWIPRDLWCAAHGFRVNNAFVAGGHPRFQAALAELGYRVDGSLVLRRAATEQALADAHVTVPVREPIDMLYPETPTSMLQDGAKVVSFHPPAETLSGERIHQWLGARRVVGKPGSDLHRLVRQQAFLRSALEQGFDFGRVVGDPELASLSDARVRGRWRMRTAGGFESVEIDGQSVLAPMTVTRRIRATTRRAAGRARARLSGTHSPRPAASARQDRAARKGGVAPAGRPPTASRGDTSASRPAENARASAPGGAP